MTDETKNEAGASERSGAPLELNEAQRSGEAPASPGAPGPQSRQRRRVYSAGEKAKILKELDSLPHGGQGAYLRQAKLYSSLVDRWRKQRDEGLEAKRGPKGKPQEVKDLERRLHEAEVRSRQLETKLKRAELVIDLQKKIQIAFGQSQESPEKPEPED